MRHYDLVRGRYAQRGLAAADYGRRRVFLVARRRLHQDVLLSRNELLSWLQPQLLAVLCDHLQQLVLLLLDDLHLGFAFLLLAAEVAAVAGARHDLCGQGPLFHCVPRLLLPIDHD